MKEFQDESLKQVQEQTIIVPVGLGKGAYYKKAQSEGRVLRLNKPIAINVSDFTRFEIDRQYGQSVTHGEIRIENFEEWEKHNELILAAAKVYCGFRVWDSELSNKMEENGIVVFKGGSHYAFHDMNGTKNRFALFTLTNGRTDTL